MYLELHYLLNFSDGITDVEEVFKELELVVFYPAQIQGVLDYVL
jgi:hypothetical protein